ncbi:EAL domain-containing protein [Sulfurimonas lithotrophica]|uniref:EAL domain-containing protein n=1 Tax=Sulfurimonas lithotrophica TaxID=2590022 RepID=A0A5P8P2V9_9BACT|nr:EAL domain-containing protein [Sulfurimonas lithotrophica]QFR50068.1 EAL domain-containing protein [Sulfurimonas lithotrophica]
MSKDCNDKVLLKALSKLTTTFAPLKGEEYYESICRYIVENFGFEYSFVGKLDESSTGMNVVSGWAKDKPITTFHYNLKNTPCDNVIIYDYVVYPNEVSKNFPDDRLVQTMHIESYAGIVITNKDQEPIGIFVVIDTKPIKDKNLAESIIKLYSGFISSEMQRYTVEQNTNDLKNIAYYDPLTKLPNRLLITDRIRRAIANQKREKNIVAICLMDLDGFKDVNDSLGHDAGDYVLIEVSRRIENIIRPEDTIARLGGDEFVIVLGDISTPEDAAKVLLRVLHVVSAPYNFREKIINTISASIGVSIYPEDHVDDDTLIRHADQAMYKAKENGKNQFYFFDIKEHVKVRANFRALRKIEKAIDNGEFELYFQPKLSAHNLQINSMEVLSRWNHPILGILSPNEFLPLIENDELIYKFDEWVIRESFLAIKKLKKKNLDVSLSVNISPKKFQQTTFVEKIKQIASEVNIDHSYFNDIEFEITENSALESINHTNDIIYELNKMGISFSLDDFGTGYSSLTHLKELNINSIKIDKSFIFDMLHNSEDMAIVNAIISLAKVFQIEVVAEGAESIEQLLMLLDFGCDSVQGYTIAKPMSFDNLVVYLENYIPDPRLKIVSKNLPRRGDFELLLAQSNHKYWIQLVIDSINRQSLEDAPHLSHESCRLGKWLKNNGKKYFSKFESFNELKTIHKKIHKEVNLIIDLLEKNGYDNQEEYIGKITNLKNDLITVIEKLKQEYSQKRG